KKNLDLSNTARTLAMMYLSGADASIACFDAKYFYNFWRPIAAIHRADEDGNDKTVPDPDWEPLIHTHPHPEYPSGHSTNSGAMVTMLALIFGDAPGVTIEASSPRSPKTHYWATFSQGIDEVLDARVYIGFHFRTSDETGARIGRQVVRTAKTSRNLQVSFASENWRAVWDDFATGSSVRRSESAEVRAVV